MTISNSDRTAGPFIGNGNTNTFPFTFKIFSRNDLLVAVTSVVNGEERILTLDADYSVAMNADQTNIPGGTITTTINLATGFTLAMTSNIANVQSLDLTNNGGFYPAQINGALDRIVVMVQQVSAKVGGGLNIGGAAAIQTVAKLGTSAGASVVGFVLNILGAKRRTVQSKLSDRVSIYDFGVIGDGIADDTAAIQAAFSACAETGQVPLIDIGKFRITSTIDAKGLPLIGRGRNHSQLACTNPDGTVAFKNVGQVVRDLWFKGPGNGKRPDGFSSSGYKRYIEGCYFDGMGDCYCPTDIIVTTVIDRTEFFACQNALNDKLCDPQSQAHTTLYLTNSNLLYGSTGFTVKIEVAGWEFDNVVFEDMANVFKGIGINQIAGCTFKGLWIEQVAQSCTIFNAIFAGSTNVYEKINVRNNANATAIIYDANKVVPSQFPLSGDGSGGGGGVAFDANGLRIADFLGNGVILRSTGIAPAAANANFSSALDYTHQTQSANANQASRGGDFVVNTGQGSLGQRRGVVRAIDDMGTEIGAQDKRWGKAWIGYLKASGAGAYVAPNALFHELSNNQPNGITLATYSTDNSANTVIHQCEYTGAGTGSLFLGKSNGAITYRVQANGNVTNTNNSYGAISDIKLKENVVDATPKLADLMRVRIVNFNLKADPGVKQLGVIAQELEKVFPGMVEETPDFETIERTRAVPAVLDAAGNEVEPARTETYLECVFLGTYTKHVKYSVLVPIMVKALQETNGRIDVLEEKIKTLNLS